MSLQLELGIRQVEPRYPGVVGKYTAEFIDQFHGHDFRCPFLDQESRGLRHLLEILAQFGALPRFGGGGHRFAAGFVTQGMPIKEAVQVVLDRLGRLTASKRL